MVREAPRNLIPTQAIIAEHRFLASIARANPARYATEAARVAKKLSSSVFSPLGELANANGDK